MPSMKDGRERLLTEAENRTTFGTQRDRDRLQAALRGVAERCGARGSPRTLVAEELAQALGELVHDEVQRSRQVWSQHAWAVLLEGVMASSGVVTISPEQRRFVGLVGAPTLIRMQGLLSRGSGGPTFSLTAPAEAGGEPGALARAMFSGPSGVTQLRLFGDGMQDPLSLTFHPAPGAVRSRATLHVLSRRPWTEPLAMDVVDSTGRSLAPYLVGSRSGLTCDMGAPLRLSYWSDGFGGEALRGLYMSGGNEDTLRGLVLNSVELTCTGGPEAFPSLTLRLHPGQVPVLGAYLGALFSPLFKEYKVDAGPAWDRVLLPHSWAAQYRLDDQHGVLPLDRVLLREEASAEPAPGFSAEGPELRRLIRAAAEHRGLCTRLDIADAVNFHLAHHPILALRGLSTSADQVSGRLEFDTQVHSVRLVLAAMIRGVAAPGARQGGRDEVQAHLRVVEDALFPYLPPGAVLHLILDETGEAGEGR